MQAARDITAASGSQPRNGRDETDSGVSTCRVTRFQVSGVRSDEDDLRLLDKSCEDCALLTRLYSPTYLADEEMI